MAMQILVNSKTANIHKRIGRMVINSNLLSSQIRPIMVIQSYLNLITFAIEFEEWSCTSTNSNLLSFINKTNNGHLISLVHIHKIIPTMAMKFHSFKAFNNVSRYQLLHICHVQFKKSSKILLFYCLPYSYILNIYPYQ